LTSFIVPGKTGIEVDKITEEYVRSLGGTCACKNYNGYPANICINVNSAAVHSIPNNKPFKISDIVKLDLVVDYNGWKADSAISVLIPPVKPEVRTLAETTYTALLAGIGASIEGNMVSDITNAIYAARGNCGVVKEFCGHGIGKNIHEAPQISNVPTDKKDSLLIAGEILCIEPIFCIGDPAIFYDPKQWDTWVLSGNFVAHFEHTLIINPAPLPPTVLTLRNNETFPN